MQAKWIAIELVFGLLLTVSLSARQTPQAAKTAKTALSPADRSFVTSAQEGNLAEVEAARLVEQKSTNPAVKDFASRMVTDHTRDSEQLKTLASAEGVTLPSALSAAERTQDESWQKLSGTKLNDAYLRDELQDHKETISAFENEIEHGQDKAVKKYAEQTLPTLQDHIRIAEDLVGKMGMSGKVGLTDESKAIAAR
jgi:putative membrane protein